MIESRRSQALAILENRAHANVTHWVTEAIDASRELDNLHHKKPWNLDYITPLQRFIKRIQLEQKLRDSAANADSASHGYDLLNASERLFVISSRKRPVVGRPYDVDELVGYIGETHVSLKARDNGRVVHGNIGGVDIRECRGKNYAQHLFSTYYPVVARRDALAASLHRNSKTRTSK